MTASSNNTQAPDLNPEAGALPEQRRRYAINHRHKSNHEKKWPGYQGVNDKPFQNPFSCHPERSEGSQPVKNTRFFAPLRMTD
jgi:hypothetical protein